MLRNSPTGNTDFWTFWPFSPLHPELCFLRAAARGSGLHRRGGVQFKDYICQYYDRRRWHKFRRSRVCFVWRNEAGGGQSPQRRWAPAKHHRILAPIRCSGFALHCICCIADRQCLFFSVFATCMVEDAAGLRTPPPVIHCCHDRQRSPLNYGSAGWRRGRLIWDGGSHLRMLFCPWSLWILSTQTHRDSHSGKGGKENNMSSRSALPSGNDRSTGDHVSAAAAYSPFRVHARDKPCVLTQRSPLIKALVGMHLICSRCKWGSQIHLFFLIR